MNGHASFNQVFLTDATVQPEFLVANVGEGWAVTTTTLIGVRSPRNSSPCASGAKETAAQSARGMVFQIIPSFRSFRNNEKVAELLMTLPTCPAMSTDATPI